MKIGRVICLVLIFTLLIGQSALAGSTMSWRFELYNQPYAEEVALSIAQAQKALKEESKDKFSKENLMDMFKEMLLSQVFSRLARIIVDDAFGDGKWNPDLREEYRVGDYEIKIEVEDDLYLVIRIRDTVTDAEEVIRIPYYNTKGHDASATMLRSTMSFDELVFD